jgi:hypothetical protein
MLREVKMAWLDPMRLLCLFGSVLFGVSCGISMGIVLGAAAGGTDVKFNALCGATVWVVFCLTATVWLLRKEMVDGSRSSW